MSKVIWKVDNTSSYSVLTSCVGIYSDKQVAIQAALNVYGRRGLVTPLLIDEYVTRPITPFDTEATLKITIQSNNIDLELKRIAMYSILNHSYTHIAKDMLLHSIPYVCYFKYLAPKRKGNKEFYIRVVGVDDIMVNDYINELRISLPNMIGMEPREIFMQCMELRCQ